ncbi:hypothetical protein LEL_10745 [Akanthomyces lecanii RCEF 1005]|uniref:Heparan-alpha-glucosaminide N-acetyltransferase catalytic domain-containing protein n=1 Tax=Akanthomyces lecanii RCEF 1005 TaxID=1081108 RepID=A0A167V035_CORDF|nr:hypothetical protein LEL_10745 [Akanthomyces lecanii RCEF 1005]
MRPYSACAGNAPAAPSVAANNPTDAATTSRDGNGSPYSSLSGYNSIDRTRLGEVSAQTSADKPTARVLALDLLRGLLMVIMAMDHLSIGLHAWAHGTGGTSEADGAVVYRWNKPAAYIVRSLTHLCAPGFMLLLGIGIVYLGTSRSQLGWSRTRLTRYFALRALALTLISVGTGFFASGGRLWFTNGVLVALAVDYLVAGLIWLATTKTEPALSGWFACVLTSTVDTPISRSPDSDSEAEQPLLRTGQPLCNATEAAAARIAWHLHNVLLATGSVVTIYWNIWLSDDSGRCAAAEHAAGSMAASPPNPLWRVWFWPVVGEHIVSPFPLLAWLSFALIGVLYGRIMLSLSPAGRATRILTGHVAVGLTFTVIFVLTRLLHFGNLSEGCLHTQEIQAHPGRNQYLVSAKDFFYIVKYPPDVAFWAATLAGNFYLLAALRTLPAQLVAKRFMMLLDFGRTALFFYVAHLVLIFSLSPWIVATFGHDTGVGNLTTLGTQRVIDSLPAFFAIWAAFMMALWPLCRWYGRFKLTKPSDSLWRFF